MGKKQELVANPTQYAELVYLRKNIKKFNANDMAEAVGISTETYLRSERGTREFTLGEAVRIANKLKMPVSEVFPKIFDLNVAFLATKGGG
ncbi:helix-turn-helix transcriptional regulator [Paenibacillus sp. B2(2019)]|uniref:helix-turn-helix transcriptional regulator n=1 Tax=Paenibacillus sp. B2(2019) TaxID=2607754 RepID=UPI0011F0D37E|nr:helix-turn-helix transcriptional regulator [Paenibacillus sp. B2(2019)]KAA1180659.1 helix-turn-helix transcriptional regulator [Paenibacillus sp. B2(2019)]